jgi:hypothetical protein
MKPHRAAIVVTAFLASSVCLVLACGSSSTGNSGGPNSDSGSGQDVTTTDTGTGPEGGNDVVTTPDGGTDGSIDASHLGFPKVIDQGIPTMSSAKVVTITFPADNMASQLQTFGQGVTQSSWYTQIIKDYCPSGGTCVGQAGVSSPQTTAAGSSYVDTSSGDPTQLPDGGVPLWTLLTSELDTGAVPPPDANTIYMFYFPSTTMVNLDGADGCNGFDGYHNQMQYTSDAGQQTDVVYAVSMECPGYQLSDVTLTSSHEIAEAATDGTFTNNTSGWYLDLNDPNALGWNDGSGGEVADMCEDIFGFGQDHTTEGAFTAQRIWSISRAALFENPCIPIPTGEVYFNAVPEKAMFIMSPGETRMFPVTGFADGALPAWTMSLVDVTQDNNNPNMQYLQMSIVGGTNTDAGSEISLNNGTVVTVSMKLLADPSNTVNGEADGLIISMNNPDPNAATKGNYWPFVVMTQAEADAQGYMEPAHRRPFQPLWRGGVQVPPVGAAVHRVPRQFASR